MRIICLSDTHGLHNKMWHDLPEGDILLHSGDCTNVGKEHQIKEFIDWFRGLKGYKKKVFCAGNHDFGFQVCQYDSWLQTLVDEKTLASDDCIYLLDQEYILENDEFSRPLKIYGSPWQPWFYDWAFNLPREGDELREKWAQIPDDTDILITHGPPFKVRDFVRKGYSVEYVGCELLTPRVAEIKPLIHLFGHIHQAYGVETNNDIVFVNASICTESYVPSNKPIIIELTEVDGKIIAKEIYE